MKFLKYLLGGIAAVFILVFAGSLLLSKSYYLERSIEIQAPPENVFPLIGELRNWAEWSPRNQMDPDMEVTYGASTTGLGGSYQWSGEKAGNGSMTISRFSPPGSIAFEMVFKGWEKSPSSSSFYLVPSSEGCRVTWDFSGEFSGNPIQRYFGVMFDKLVGDQYETGLVNIKSKVEAD